MDIYSFYAALSKQCEAGKCDSCELREFCFTAPASMTKEIIQEAIIAVQGFEEVGPHSSMECQIH